MNTEVAETDEIEEAAQRFLAFLPEETRAMLGNAEHILGMTQLVAENAKRCGVEATGPDWDSGLGEDDWGETWTVRGAAVSIQTPMWHRQKLWEARPWRGVLKPKIEAPTFPELFDGIVAAVTSGELGPDEPSAICSGTSDDWSGWPLPTPIGPVEIYAVDRSADTDGQPKGGHASSPEHRGCLYRTMLWAQ